MTRAIEQRKKDLEERYGKIQIDEGKNCMGPYIAISLLVRKRKLEIRVNVSELLYNDLDMRNKVKMDILNRIPYSVNRAIELKKL